MTELVELLQWTMVGATDLVVVDSAGSGHAVLDESGIHYLTTPPATTDGSGEAVVWTTDELWRR